MIDSISSEEIVQRMKGELAEKTNVGGKNENQLEDKPNNPSFSQEPRARRLLSEGKVVHNPQLKVFTVMGSIQAHNVTLFHKEVCIPALQQQAATTYCQPK